MRGLVLLLALLGSLPPAAGEVFKWTDGSGRVHYSDRPPAGAGTPVPLRASPAPDPGREAREEHRRRLLEAYERERSQRKAQSAKAREDSADRARRCAYAREELRRRERTGRMFDFDEAGRRHYLSGEEVDRAREDARAAVRRWCDT